MEPSPGDCLRTEECFTVDWQLSGEPRHLPARMRERVGLFARELNPALPEWTRVAPDQREG